MDSRNRLEIICQKLKSDYSPFGYKFKYYEGKMIDKLIDVQLLKTARKQKLDLIKTKLKK